RLLTPNWQSRLPGFGYDGDDPDGFRGMPETIDYISRYAAAISAPVKTHTKVTSVNRTDTGYRVATDQGDWHCRTLVLASGACNIANVPPLALAIPDHIAQVTPTQYRNPDQLAEGGVMVVGVAATGAQLAQEIHQSGRPITVSVGEHVRVPRTYRGRDIQWWMDRTGLMDERYDDIDDINRARSLPSFQLTGSDNRAMLDLNALSSIGVKLIGRIAGMNDGKAQFSGSLRNMCALADLKMGRLLDTIDEWVSENDFDGEVDPAERFAPTEIEDNPPLGMDLRNGEIKTIVWATGFRPDHSWLDVPVFDRKGRVRHDGGIVDSPGLYMMGQQFLRRRKSSLIDGAGDDARDLSDHLAAYLAG
ncbi:MAG: NAD(P)-binding domain-containing protein, partial [Alphaproteobacteria bacterium]|nr:NAD(P)-binding domain-containing protein [Alphaproteobacteria bacterium]